MTSPPASTVRRNLGTVLARSNAAGRGAREAVRFGEERRSFADLLTSARRVANGFSVAGIRKGDRVAVLLRNGLEWVEVFFGLSELGAVCVPVNVLLKPAEIASMCDDAEVRAFVVDEHGVAAFEELARRPDLVVGVGGALPHNPGGRALRYEDLVTARAAPVEDPPDLGDPLVFYYTSGTTGAPKAAVHTHDGILWNSFHQIPDLALTEDDVYLVVPSLSWAAGFHDIMLAALWLGGRSVVMPTGGITVERIADTARRSGATRTLLVPTLLKHLLDDRRAQETLRGSRLRMILTGSEPVPLPVVEELHERLPQCRIVQGYGLSEFPSIATILREDEAAARAGSAGRPTSVCDLAVLDDRGDIRGDGEGEILLRSMATMQGYWRRPAETTAAFEHGWLHTGDLGRVDAEGYVTITGRKKDMIISGGLNVYPSEVEAVLYGFPGVREAAVVGAADARWGEVPVAVVVADGPLDPAAMLAHCSQRLASYKTPRRVLLRLERLPRSPSGKVLKRELRPWVEERLERDR